MRLIPADPLTALQAAKTEVRRQKALVLAEMDEKAEQGILWENGKCKAWADYWAAEQRLSQLRQEHGA